MIATHHHHHKFNFTQLMARWGSGEAGGGKGRCVGSLWVTLGSLWVTLGQGVRVANLVWELIIGIETVRDRRKPKYAINRTILDKNFHKQLILRMYWQRKAMKHP